MLKLRNDMVYFIEFDYNAVIELQFYIKINAKDLRQKFMSKILLKSKIGCRFSRHNH